jgi:spermidine synthase
MTPRHRSRSSPSKGGPRPLDDPGMNRPLPLWAVVCFFSSGAAALLYEVAWSKQLSYTLGNSLHAIATVVAAFLAGLAIGARFLGVPLARRGNGARTYARLELGVAALGVISLPILRGLEPFVGILYRALGGEGAAFALARVLLLFVILVPPAALMGATLPVLVGYFERTWIGPQLARLYAINTFGAVAGSVAGGFLLMPVIGLRGTTWVAAALNVMVAGIATKAAAKAPSIAASKPKEPSTEPGSAREPVARSIFTLLFALSGVSALAFQIVWVRLFGLTLGSTVYSFSAVLGVYLLGLALGSSVAGRFLRRGTSYRSWGHLQIALAVATALMLYSFSHLPDWMWHAVGRAGTRWGALLLSEVGLVALLLLVPCAILGAAFPVATRLLQVRDGGHAAGVAYAVNTVGTIAGSLLAGFFAIPTWGVQGTHLAAMWLSLAIGLGALFLGRQRGTFWVKRVLPASVALAMVVILAGLAPRWDPALMSNGIYRPAQALRIGQAARAGGGESPVRQVSRYERVLYYREGLNGSVLVGSDPLGQNRWLSVGGKIDASTGDMETQVLLGLLPAALADSGAHALVIGLGSGTTASAVLAAGAGPTDVVELEPGVVEASRFFHAPGMNPLDDPRVTLILGDARTHLEHSGRRYGIIVSEPSNPWIAGVNNLFTVDFYRRVRDQLEPDGVFCQWLQVYELSPETFASLLGSFSDVFPDAYIFSIWRGFDLLLVAAPAKSRLALERLQSPAVARLLAEAKIRSPLEISAHYAGPLAAMAASLRAAPRNRDDRPIVEYRAPRDMVRVGGTTPNTDPRVIGAIPFVELMPDGALYASWTPEEWYASRARFLMAYGQRERAAVVARGADQAGFPELAQRLRKEIEAADRRAQAQERVEAARTLSASRRPAEAARELERAVEIDPDCGIAWAMLAEERKREGNIPGAEAALVHAESSPDSTVRASSALVAASLELGQGRPLAAAERCREAQRLNPRLAQSYLLEARALREGGDVAGARAAILRGLRVLPEDRELQRGQAEQVGQ